MDAANKSKICRFFEAFEIKPNNSIAFLHPDKMRWAISRVSGLTRQDFLPASSPIICAKYGVTKIKHRGSLRIYSGEGRADSIASPQMRPSPHYNGASVLNPHLYRHLLAPVSLPLTSVNAKGLYSMISTRNHQRRSKLSRMCQKQRSLSSWIAVMRIRCGILITIY